MDDTIEITVDRSGERLDSFLGGRLGSRSAAQRAISEGRVAVDGIGRPKSAILDEGQVVTVAPAAPRLPSAPEENGPPVDVAWEDDRIAVVEKPIGVVSHPAPGHPRGTLVQALSSGRGGAWVGLVHRLDQDTSGLLSVAWDEEALQSMRELLQHRELTREYTALVVGAPRTSEGTVDAPIGRDRRSRTRMSTRTDNPREAVTHFEVLESFASFTLLRVRLETGRTHQIRVHLSEAGIPVAGDPVYGREGALGLGRQFLHASRLAFPHPFTGEAIEVESQLPADLATALDLARSGGI